MTKRECGGAFLGESQSLGCGKAGGIYFLADPEILVTALFGVYAFGIKVVQSVFCQNRQYVCEGDVFEPPELISQLGVFGEYRRYTREFECWGTQRVAPTRLVFEVIRDLG